MDPVKLIAHGSPIYPKADMIVLQPVLNRGWSYQDRSAPAVGGYDIPGDPVFEGPVIQSYSVMVIAEAGVQIGIGAEVILADLILRDLTSIK